MRRAGILLFLSLLVACDAGGPIGSTSCASDADCFGVDVCVVGVCVDPRSEDLETVDLEIIPEADLGPPQQIRGVAIGESRANLTLRQGVTVRGNVALSTGERVLSVVRAVPEDGIPGRALVVTARADGPQGEFELPLLGGGAYRLTVLPDDDTALPPVSVQGSVVVSGVSQEIALPTVIVPAPPETHRVTGRVVTRDGATALGVADLEVKIVQDGRRISTLARTDPSGEFRVELPPEGFPGAKLVVRPTESNRLTPSLEVPLEALEDEVELGDVDLGALSAPVSLVGVVNGPGGVEVAGARIRAVGQVGNGQVDVAFFADDEGRYEFELRPGEYVFSVLAPTDNPSAGLLEGFAATVTADGPAPMLNVPERVLMEGTVRDADGDAIEGALVTLTRVSVEDDLGTWTFDAVTGDDGRWQASVDPGRYRAIADPGAAAGLPRQVLVFDVAPEAEPLDIALPPVAAFAATLLADGAPVSSARVVAFAPFPDATGAPIVLGEGVSGSDGEISIVLPDLTRPAPAENGQGRPPRVAE
jgi:hypothetical protein